MITAGKLIAQMRAAQRELASLPPPATHIKIGSILRFAEAVERATGQPMQQGPGLWGSFSGIPVEVSMIVPENFAVVMSGNDILQIICLDEHLNAKAR